MTLRRALLDHLGAKPGDKLTVEPLPDGGVAVRAVARQHDISEVFGMLKRPSQPTLSIDEINAIIAQGWAGELADRD